MGRYFSKRALKQRMREPSTWAGLAIVASALGSTVGIPPDLTQYLVLAGGVMSGVLPEATRGPDAESQ